jgi:hypothetical protein
VFLARQASPHQVSLVAAADLMRSGPSPQLAACSRTNRGKSVVSILASIDRVYMRRGELAPSPRWRSSRVRLRGYRELSVYRQQDVALEKRTFAGFLPLGLP